MNAFFRDGLTYAHLWVLSQSFRILLRDIAELDSALEAFSTHSSTQTAIVKLSPVRMRPPSLTSKTLAHGAAQLPERALARLQILRTNHWRYGLVRSQTLTMSPPTPAEVLSRKLTIYGMPQVSALKQHWLPHPGRQMLQGDDIGLLGRSGGGSERNEEAISYRRVY